MIVNKVDEMMRINYKRLTGHPCLCFEEVDATLFILASTTRE
jgi:hypothetical protein